jgi:hypothetical protein
MTHLLLATASFSFREKGAYEKSEAGRPKGGKSVLFYSTYILKIKTQKER